MDLLMDEDSLDWDRCLEPFASLLKHSYGWAHVPTVAMESCAWSTTMQDVPTKGFSSLDILQVRYPFGLKNFPWTSTETLPLWSLWGPLKWHLKQEVSLKRSCWRIFEGTESQQWRCTKGTTGLSRFSVTSRVPLDWTRQSLDAGGH